jgi:iron complex transport system substrate-binding protein
VRLDVEKIASPQTLTCALPSKTATPSTVVRKLESVDIPVYAVDPRNLEAVMDTLMELGRLLDVGDRAGAMSLPIWPTGSERVRQPPGQRRTYRPAVFFQIGICADCLGGHTGPLSTN